MSCIFFTVLSHYKYNVKVITMQYIVLFFQQKISFYGHEIEMYTVEQGEKRDKRQ